MKIYTKTGDTGETSLFAGGRVKKHDPRVESYGTVDELNAHLGFLRTYEMPQQAQAWLEDIQNVLFVVGSDLATPLDSKADWLVRLDDAPALRLESGIDEMTAALEPLRSFILPGGTPAAAYTHIARTVCRRAERDCVALAQEQPVNGHVLVYLNRLSDFLFTLARWLNHRAGESETKWSVRG